MNFKKMYVAPQMEHMDVELEQGIAAVSSVSNETSMEEDVQEVGVQYYLD